MWTEVVTEANIARSLKLEDELLLQNDERDQLHEWLQHNVVWLIQHDSTYYVDLISTHPPNCIQLSLTILWEYRYGTASVKSRGLKFVEASLWRHLLMITTGNCVKCVKSKTASSHFKCVNI